MYRDIRQEQLLSLSHSLEFVTGTMLSLLIMKAIYSGWAVKIEYACFNRADFTQ